jgi:signal transduction histidine kinase
MAIPPDYLPIDTTAEPCASARCLLTIQAAIIDQIAQVTRGTGVIDQVLHSVTSQLQQALQVSSCLIFQVDERQQMAIAIASVTTAQHDCAGSANTEREPMQQILENLLSNALKYSPPGSTVEFTLSYLAEQAVFQIRDRGIGIPSEDLHRLFETFHRATNVGTISGTGLGLAIVKRCVDIHQGQIAVESEIGVGTTFIVTLPLYNSIIS